MDGEPGLGGMGVGGADIAFRGISPGDCKTQPGHGFRQQPAAATDIQQRKALKRLQASGIPAEPAGGTAYLASLGSPLPQGRFCPTGGITAANAGEFLALDNVLCVGGSWLSPADALAQGDWPRITRLARQARELKA